jgi:hypothetical protein
MESSMQQLSEHRAWPRIGRTLATAAALLCATALGQPHPAYAGPQGGGGGGGFHGGGGGFRGGGFHGGFAGIHNDFGERREGFGQRREGFRGGFIAYPWWGYYPDYGYDYSQPYSSQTWYYCSDPAGYYPYVTQCSTGWQTVPAS